MCIRHHCPTFECNTSKTCFTKEKKINFFSFFINFSFETSNGISENEQGQLRLIPGDEAESVVVQGAYSWVDPEGNSHSVRYVADENGFQPESADIPQAPSA